jgi:beta-lactamase class A
MLLLEAIYSGKVLNKQFTDDFFNLLSIPKSSYIPRELPEDLRIANKPGELEGVRNDCGLIFTGSRPYILCAMSTYLRSERAAGDAISRMSGETYRMFDRLSRAGPLGRVVSPHDSSIP